MDCWSCDEGFSELVTCGIDQSEGLERQECSGSKNFGGRVGFGVIKWACPSGIRVLV